MYFEQREIIRKAELVGILERVCESLELTATQEGQAKSRYEGVAEWLAKAENSLLHGLLIYLQGSTALATTVKPISQNEHDVDLVCLLPSLGPWVEPMVAKKVIGDQLRANGHYRALLEEKQRCWRLSYANEFHLDITPSIRNPACSAGGELVPDKELRQWKASNPRGYKALFERRASLVPRMLMQKAIIGDAARANVEPYPVPLGFKGVLRRSVQLAKRNRDVRFADIDPSLAPLSIIITTLASRSYEYCVRKNVYQSELDLLCDVTRHMPDFIEVRTINGQPQWFIWNETTSDENFAEKWNAEPERAEAFFDWHWRILTELEALNTLEGLDRLTKSLNSSFGSAPVTQAIDSLTGRVSAARSAGVLAVTPKIGLAIGSPLRSTSVPSNTFYGAE